MQDLLGGFVPADDAGGSGGQFKANLWLFIL
jgi:hypothetical protein